MMFGEEFTRVRNRCNRHELRKFGFSIGILLFGVTGLIYWRAGGSSGALWLTAVAGGVLMAGAALAPQVLRPLYLGWMAVAVLLGAIATRLILLLLFFLVFAPVGLVLKSLGKDPLKRAIDRQCDSYWLDRASSDDSATQAEKQF